MLVMPPCSEKDPIQAIIHSCDAFKSSVKITVGYKSCSSMLYFIKYVDIFLGVEVPSCRCVVEGWLDHSTVGY